jgi:hypothetical protein
VGLPRHVHPRVCAVRRVSIKTLFHQGREPVCNQGFYGVLPIFFVPAARYGAAGPIVSGGLGDEAGSGVRLRRSASVALVFVRVGASRSARGRGSSPAGAISDWDEPFEPAQIHAAGAPRDVLRRRVAHDGRGGEITRYGRGGAFTAASLRGERRSDALVGGTMGASGAFAPTTWS